jgi:hypothetical protein
MKVGNHGLFKTETVGYEKSKALSTVVDEVLSRN